MIITAPLLISILLTAEFLPIANFIRLVSIGVFFQAAKQSIDFISFAKGDKQTFLMLSIVGSSLLLISSIIGYNANGLNGTAVMFIVHSIIIYSLIYYVVYKKYDYIMSKRLTKISIVGICPIVLVYMLLFFIPNVLGYILSSLLLCLSIIYSIYELDQLVGLKEIYSNFLS